MRRRAILLAVCLGLAAAAPEPTGYWSGAMDAPVPATIAGGQVIHTPGLIALQKARPIILIDVAKAPRRPPAIAAGAPWLPLPHRDIPGSVWLPDAGLPALPPQSEASLRHRLATLTRGNTAATIVVYCHSTCWLSWNASHRLIQAGYTDIRWYPDGVEGWTAAGLPTAQP